MQQPPASRSPFAMWKYLAVAAIVVACGDNITAPDAARAPAIPQPPRPTSDIIVMERTIDIAAHEGAAAVHRTFSKTLTPQLRVAGAEPAPIGPGRPGPDGGLDIAALPLPAVSLPARYETAMCSAQPDWKRTLKSSVVTRGNLEMSGVGDAPASTLRIVEDGKTIATIERTWVRTPTSWQLQRQVTTSADGRYRDVVTYRHLKAANREAVNNELSTATCAPVSSAKITSPAAASRSYYAPRVSSFLAPPTGVSVYLGDTCGGYGGDPCYNEQLGLYEAQAGVVATAAVVGMVCNFWGRVPTLGTVSCAAALISYGLAVTREGFAKARLENCLREQAAKCSCGGGSGGTELYSKGTTPMSGSPSISISPPGIPGTTSTIGAPSTPSYYYGDCDYYGGGGGGGGGGDGGGGGGGGGGGCAYRVWEISYDGGVTWHYWGTIWTCTDMA